MNKYKNHHVFSHKTELSAVIMASGHGKRFGSNKLMTEIGSKPMIENLFMAIPGDLFLKTVVVSIYPEVLRLAEDYGYTAVFNDDVNDDTSVTIKLGINNIDKRSRGCMFFVGDQPLLSTDTIINSAASFYEAPDMIHRVSCGSVAGNPVVFPEACFDELASLKSHQKGSDVIRNHPDMVTFLEIPDINELIDVDFTSDIQKILR